MNRKAYFDLETTGVGKGVLGTFTDPVGIYSAGYKIGKNKAKGLFGKTSTPMEEGARHIAKLGANKRGLADAVMTETAMLKQFVNELKEDGVDELVGFNIHNYDSPLLEKRMRHLGLSNEADYIKNVKHTDVMHMVKSNMDHALSGYEGKIDWEYGPGEIPRGLSLEAVASGLGIRSDSAHAAISDVEMTQKVHEIASNGDEFTRRFNVSEWAKATDELHMSKQRRKRGLPSEYTGDGGIPESAFEKVTGRSSLHSQVMSAEGAAPIGTRVPSEGHTIHGRDLPAMGGDWSGTDKVEDDAERIAEKHGVSINEAIDIAKDRLNKGKDELLKGMGEVVKKGHSASNFLPSKHTAAIVGGLLGGAWLLDKVSENEAPIDEANFVSSNALGQGSRGIAAGVGQASNMEDFNRMADRSSSAERQIVEKVQKDFNKSNVSYSDPHLGVKGTADAVTSVEGQNIPISIKAVDDDMLNSIDRPMSNHSANANFLAHSTGSDHGYVMYVSKRDSSKRKTFRVAYDPGSLMAQVQEFRSAVYMAEHNTGWSSPLDSFFGNRSGTRDQANRSNLHHLPRTEQTENHSYVGSRSIPRN